MKNILKNFNILINNAQYNFGNDAYYDKTESLTIIVYKAYKSNLIKIIKYS